MNAESVVARTFPNFVDMDQAQRLRFLLKEISRRTPSSRQGPSR